MSQASLTAEKLFPLLLENLQDYALFMTDLQGLIVAWTPGVQRVLGYAESEFVGQDTQIIFIPEDRVAKVPETEMRQALQHGRADDTRWHVRKDGTRLWANGQLIALADDTGQVQGFAKLLRDETARKQAEDAWQASAQAAERESAEAARRESAEATLLQVVESVEDYAIFTTDAKGFVTSWNRGAEITFGWKAAEIIGQSGDILFTPEDRAHAVPEYERETALRTGRSEDERFHLHKDGSRFYVSGVTTSLKAGAATGFVKVARDQTQKIRTELALRDREIRFRTLADAVPQLIWTNEAGGRADYFNQRWFDYSGLSYEESEGLGWQAMVHPDDALASVERWNEALRQGEVFETEYRLRRFDGSYRWHIGRNMPLLDEAGHVTGWFGTATDIEDLKQTESQLQLAQEELEARVEERTHELGEALEQVRAEIKQRREAEAARAELVKRIVTTQEEERGRISRELHDNLGQHLTAVMLGLQALETQISTMTGGERQHSAPQLETLREQVNGLMKAAHRQAWELRPAELDAMGVEVALEQYIRDWSGRTGTPVDFQALGWKNRRPDGTIETTLYRVAQEALTNVARHSGARQVDIVLKLEAGLASVIIEDNGQGFDPERVTSRLGVLGMQERLSIVSGTLEIESSPGEGTTIFARVPLRTAPREVDVDGVSTEPTEG